MVANNLNSTDYSLGQIEQWYEQIAAIGKGNPLRNFELNPFAQIDLEKSHPGGLAQFVSSGTTKLSNLVRDPLAFSRATAAAKRIQLKHTQLVENYGIPACYLAGGIVSLNQNGFDLTLPILLWRVELQEHGDDFEVNRIGSPVVNPELIDAFVKCFDVKIDQAKLLSKLESSTDLVPISVLEYLEDLGGSQALLDQKRILVISNFAVEPTYLARDLNEEKFAKVQALFAQKTSPEMAGAVELLLPLDADENQKLIIRRALAGHSFAVDTLPGCGYTQTVSNLLVNLVSANKKVLVVANRQQTLSEISDRLSSVGLSGLQVRSTATWFDLVSAISRNEKSKPANLEEIVQQRHRVQENLDKYFNSLQLVIPELQVSVTQVLEKLARLAALPHAPQTLARIPSDKLLALKNAEPALDLLTRAADLGEFNFGPQDSAWFSARFESEAQVAEVLKLVRRLKDEAYPQLASSLAEFISAAEFKPANNVAMWGTYLNLFTGIRDSLDHFNSDVFDRPLHDVIMATAARKVKGEMSGRTRRRLKKLAKEFIRPGMHVNDLHASLIAVQEQRKLWAQYAATLKPPMVPAGINEAQKNYQSLIADFGIIQQHLDAASPQLQELELSELEAKLNSLVRDTGILENFQAKADVKSQLHELGIEPLARDLARLHSKREHIAIEFDLAWWQSALEYLISQNADLLGFTVEEVTSLEAQFRNLGEEISTQSAIALGHQLSQSWQFKLKEHSSEVEVFRSLLKSGSAQLFDVLDQSQNLSLTVSPAVALSPLQVPLQLPAAMEFDVVLVLDAAGAQVAECLAALARAKQVMTFGDEVIANAVGFEIEPSSTSKETEPAPISIHALVKNHFGAEALRTNYRPHGQVLGAFINREFYQNRIAFEPTSDDYFNNSHVVLDLVTAGARATSTDEGANESLNDEVIKTVELIFNHALWHPEDSLMVATPSALHAERIRASVTAGLKARPDLTSWFESHGRERFEVSTLSELRHRIADRVIFSLGFGKTPHGAVLSNFGDLSTPDSRRSLANLLVSARKEIHVVSCFEASELDSEKLTNGAKYLKDLLEAATQVEVETFELDGDPMLQDLVTRLRKLGVTVKTGFGQQLSLVASYANRAKVIGADWNLKGQSLDEKLRIHPKLLQALGWDYERVLTFDLFSDPAVLASRIAESLGVAKASSAQKDEPVQTLEPESWSEFSSSNDEQLKADKPPHWG